jgi:superfamily I DNA/RNA helicase
MIETSRVFLRRVEDQARAGASDASLSSWLDGFLKEIGLAEALREESKGERGGDIRVENLREFVDSLAGYERRIWSAVPLPDEEIDWAPPTIAGFLEGVSLFGDTEAEDDKDKGDADQVSLLTLHSAKGLEFVHVFLVGLEEEILPHIRSVHEIAEGTATDPIAEERRLFYVGITRARHRLTLSGCRNRRRGTEWLPRQPSRFLKEIPTELLDVRTAATESSLTETDRTELRENFFEQMRNMLGK